MYILKMTTKNTLYTYIILITNINILNTTPVPNKKQNREHTINLNPKIQTFQT